ncbi:hypothetical protein QBC45DRAFT_388067 [Copromyces sp. CBS 386.78]|nr:hypothetical protein QBC45DRAFT_388067 [Copromyces sp. CBS 386.78]
MAPPVAPKAEVIPDNGDSFKNHLAQVAEKLSRSGVLLRDNYPWTVGARGKLEDELKRERNSAYKQRSSRSSNSRPSAAVEDKHHEPKVAHGQRRKREDHDDDDETTEERLTKRRNVNVDEENCPLEPLLTTAHPQAPAQATPQPVHAHKFPCHDDGPWHQAIYNQVYKKVYSEIYDEAYSKAYNLAYNDAFKAGYEHGGADGEHDGNNRGFEDGYDHGYKKTYRLAYAEGQEMVRDMLSSDEEEEEQSTVRD